jgi:hypothetical protein
VHYVATLKANGSIVADPARFPSGMAALAEYVHSKGLLFGIYTAQCSLWCCVCVCMGFHALAI